MLFINRLLLVGLLSVGISAATTAQAGNQLFEGSWLVKAFGNELTGGAGESEFYSAWGIAFDGDGDRAIFVDENGEIVDGDHIMAICATRMIKEGRLKENTLVSTVMSNMGLDDAIIKAGGNVIRTEVGDRYVVEELLKGGYNLGGEQSGHMIFMDHHTTGDGIISALQVLSVMVKEGKKLSELKSVMHVFPQVLLNVKVKERKRIEDIPQICQQIKIAEEKLKDRGRVYVRYSGTESVVRILIEGMDKNEISPMADKIAETIGNSLG